jgi:ribosomal protein L12E/L44/L45/RPP1/RPP2
MVGIQTSRIIGAIDDTVSALNGVNEACDNIKEATDLPRAFHVVLGRVDLVLDTVGKAKSHIRTCTHSEKTYEAILVDMEDCMKKSRNLRTVFSQVVPQADAPRLERYRQAVGALGKGSRVETLMKAVLEDVHRLVGRCESVKESKTVKAVDKKRLEELVEAIKEMSNVPPSLPEDAPGGSVNNYGSGTLNANTGEGTQNNNTGTGRQYIGGTMHFGKDH